MRRYDSYKLSDIEWIGEIPSEWDIIRLRHTGDLYGGLAGKGGDDFKQEENPNNKPYIPYTNIFNNTYISRNHFDYVVLKDGEKQNRVKKFDLFFLMSSETYEDLGKSSILIDDVDELYLNSFCKGLRVTNERVYPLFLNYELLGYTHKELISVEGHGFTRINLRQDRLVDTPILLPPLSEQLQIVQYLDTKTSQIDSLIQKTERKIELLREQRTSLINHVVTKGLNPKVKMKDSGVEWIGEIPEHWEVRRIWTIGRFSKGSGITKDDVRENGYPCIRYGEIYTKYERVFTNTVSFVDKEKTVDGVTISKGDVLLTGSGETVEDIGRSVVYYGEEKIYVGGDIIILKLNDEVDPLFISYLMNTPYVQHQKSIQGKGEIVVHIYPKNIREINITFPEKTEQLRIVKHLDEKTSTVDDTIQIEMRRIETLKEYRQSLISEVVTGKIKVTSDG